MSFQPVVLKLLVSKPLRLKKRISCFDKGLFSVGKNIAIIPEIMLGDRKIKLIV